MIMMNLANNTRSIASTTTRRFLTIQAFPAISELAASSRYIVPAQFKQEVLMEAQHSGRSGLCLEGLQEALKSSSLFQNDDNRHHLTQLELEGMFYQEGDAPELAANPRFRKL